MCSVVPKRPISSFSLNIAVVEFATACFRRRFGADLARCELLGGIENLLDQTGDDIAVLRCAAMVPIDTLIRRCKGIGCHTFFIGSFRR